MSPFFKSICNLQNCNGSFRWLNEMHLLRRAFITPKYLNNGSWITLIVSWLTFWRVSHVISIWVICFLAKALSFYKRTFYLVRNLERLWRTIKYLISKERKNLFFWYMKRRTTISIINLIENKIIEKEICYNAYVTVMSRPFSGMQ